MEREIKICTDLSIFSCKTKIFLSVGILLCVLNKAGTKMSIMSKWFIWKVIPRKYN